MSRNHLHFLSAHKFIVDSEPVHDWALRKTLEECGIIVNEVINIGFTDEAFFDAIRKKHNINMKLHEFIDRKTELVIEKMGREIPIVKGVNNLIDKLHKSDLKLALASGSHHDFIEFVLIKGDLLVYFPVIVGGEDVKNSKPDPEIFLKAASMLSISPSECVVIEDSTTGIMAAKSAGMGCIGFSNPYSGNQDLSKADFIVDDFSKLDVDQLVSFKY